MIKVEDKVGKFIQTAFNCKIPPDLNNLFLISQSQFIRVYNESLHAEEWSQKGMLSSITSPDRGKLLDNFAKFEFFINQLLALKIVEFDYWNRGRIDDLINELNFYNKTKLLKNWGVISSQLKKKIDEVMKVRNQLAHSFDIYEITYNEQPLQIDRNLSNFNKFKDDMNEVWKSTIAVYQLEQEKMDIEKLIQRIQEYNKKP